MTDALPHATYKKSLKRAKEVGLGQEAIGIKSVAVLLENA
jgi:hypothetical protein